MKSRAKATIFIDGAADSTHTLTIARLGNSTWPLIVGSPNALPPRVALVEMDDVRLYNRFLGAGEISALANYGLSPEALADWDGDGATNIQEYHNGTDANLADSDGDGTPDGVEINGQFLPGRGKIYSNPRMVDTDGDGLSDAHERNISLTDPGMSDSDGDGIWDGREINEVGSNPLLADSDGDKMPDGWEAAYKLNPLSAADATENPDGDLLDNLAEFMAGTNPLVKNGIDFNLDSDGDGISDYMETHIYGTNPHTTHTFAGTMSDADRINSNFLPPWLVPGGPPPAPGSDPGAGYRDNEDFDGDGASNTQENADGTNPSDPANLTAQALGAQVITKRKEVEVADSAVKVPPQEYGSGEVVKLHAPRGAAVLLANAAKDASAPGLIVSGKIVVEGGGRKLEFPPSEDPTKPGDAMSGIGGVKPGVDPFNHLGSPAESAHTPGGMAFLDEDFLAGVRDAEDNVTFTVTRFYAPVVKVKPEEEEEEEEEPWNGEIPGIGGSNIVWTPTYGPPSRPGTPPANDVPPEEPTKDAGLTFTSTTIWAVVFSMAVDANRDGTVGDPQDNTEEDKPFGFWVNDDDDSNDKDHPGSALKDSYFDINSKRDLEDYTRLWISIAGLQKDLKSGTLKIGLRWKNPAGFTPPAIKVFQAVETDGGTKYLTGDSPTDDSTATAQISGEFGKSKAMVGGEDIVNLPKTLFAELGPDDKNCCLLFDGVEKGKAELEVVLLDKNDQEMTTGNSVWMDIKDIKKMYRRAITTPHTLPVPWSSYEGPYDASRASWTNNDLGYVVEKPWDEESKVFVYVNGSNESDATSTSNAETMFKRLWHQGYKGRFSHFRWDTLVGTGDGTLPAQYNLNEWIAWTYGNSLMNYMASQPVGYTRNVCGHSLGNVVVGSALQRGMKVSNYLLMQAALPAGCYDMSDAINNYERFVKAEINSPTPDWAGDLGYRGILSEVSGNFINLYNPQDYALVSGLLGAWEGNQINYKPDNPALLVQYKHYPIDYPNPAQAGKSYLDNLAGLFLREVTENYEGMSFVGRSRSQAAGAISTGGPIRENVPLGSSPYNFGRERSDHSAQFTRRIQQLDAFYQKVYDTVR